MALTSARYSWPSMLDRASVTGSSALGSTLLDDTSYTPHSSGVSVGTGVVVAVCDGDATDDDGVGVVDEDAVPECDTGGVRVGVWDCVAAPVPEGVDVTAAAEAESAITRVARRRVHPPPRLLLAAAGHCDRVGEGNPCDVPVGERCA